MPVIFCESCTLGVAFLQAFQPFLCAETVVGFAFFYQLFCVIHIHAHAFALDIRAVFPANIGAFVMLQASHFQCFINHVRCAFHKPPLVGVLNTQYEFSAL